MLYLFIRLGRSDSSQQVSSHSNVEEPTEETVDQQFTANLLKDVVKDTVDESRQNESSEVEDYHEFKITDFEEDAVEYIAGYIIKRLKLNGDTAVDSSYFTWVDQVSEGGLVKPHPEFVKKILCLEKLFNTVHGKTFNFDGKALGMCLDLAKSIDLPNNAKLLFFRTRLYIRIKYLNKNVQNIKTKSKKIKKTIT